MHRTIFQIVNTHSDTNGHAEVVYSCGHYGREYVHDLPLSGNCKICDCKSEIETLDTLEELCAGKD